jgi:hypothetical protein
MNVEWGNGYRLFQRSCGIVRSIKAWKVALACEEAFAHFGRP